ncbi:uncharacterized protein LOC121375023 isoform X2 [Gigantopelta aegis]|uniref:uncharacterized protein LOC121375023 isoform X2 n=1 Tax=Gigantopelta aegis TaxID=1735272 RepID=UPI001B88BC6B|nr:uncharacterized protein LOC121375023 isoform X2 [Gigantopelta aegis]
MAQKKERTNCFVKSNQLRKSEKVVRVPLTGWAVDSQKEDYGITQWCEWSSNRRKSKITGRKFESEDNYCEIFRNCFREKCSSIDNYLVFQRESLIERFQENCQFSGSHIDTSEIKPTADEEKDRDTRSVKSKDEPKSPRRLCKSANSSSHSRTGTPGQNGVTADDTLSVPPRSHSVTDIQSDTHADVEKVLENKPKVSKLAPLAVQKYIQKEDAMPDEGEDENDEGYGSKISSNETEVDVADSSGQQGQHGQHGQQGQHGHHGQHTGSVIKQEDGGKVYQNESTFKWIRENDNSRIVKLSYSQKDKSIYSESNDNDARNVNLTGETNTQQGGRCIRGIMAASLSHLSPGTMHFHHLRDPNKMAYLNHVDSPRWGYENNSNGQFLPNREQKVTDNTPEIKPTAIVLRKVTIQNCNGNEQENTTPDVKNDESLRDTMSSRERTRFSLHRTSPQLIVDSTKLPRNVSIPSSRHYTYYTDSANNSFVTHLENPKTPMSGVIGDCDETLSQLYITDRSTPGYFPIGDLLPAVERNIRQRSDNLLHKSASAGSFSYSAKDSKQSLMDSRSISDNDTTMITKQDVEIIHASYIAPHGPPAFRPLYARSPLQRAREIATRRLHGHVTQQPDGSSTIRVSSPRFGYRHDTRPILRQDTVDQMDSAGRKSEVKLALLGSVSKLQHRSYSARSTTSRRNRQRPIQRERVIGLYPDLSN